MATYYTGIGLQMIETEVRFWMAKNKLQWNHAMRWGCVKQKANGSHLYCMGPVSPISLSLPPLQVQEEIRNYILQEECTCNGGKNDNHYYCQLEDLASTVICCLETNCFSWRQRKHDCSSQLRRVISHSDVRRKDKASEKLSCWRHHLWKGLRSPEQQQHCQNTQ